MTAKDTINSRYFKKQLQAATAKRRSNNHDQAQISVALNVNGRNDLQPAFVTVSRSVNSLHPSINRTRETTTQLLGSTIRSIKKFGMVLPILIDKHGTIVAGHVLWEAAMRLGLEVIECRVVDHLDPVELEALSLALNRIGEIGKYNLDKLRDRMIKIESHGIELISTGFTLPEIDQIKLKPLSIENNVAEDDEEDGTAVVTTSRAGDLFRLGRHQLLCGDALDEMAYQRLLGGSAAHAAFSDPPYNCKIEGFVGGLGKHKHEDFLMFAGKESDAEFRQFLQTYLTLCRVLERLEAGVSLFAFQSFDFIILLRAEACRYPR